MPERRRPCHSGLGWAPPWVGFATPSKKLLYSSAPYRTTSAAHCLRSAPSLGTNFPYLPPCHTPPKCTLHSCCCCSGACHHHRHCCCCCCCCCAPAALVHACIACMHCAHACAAARRSSVPHDGFPSSSCMPSKHIDLLSLSGQSWQAHFMSGACMRPNHGQPLPGAPPGATAAVRAPLSLLAFHTETSPR